MKRRKNPRRKYRIRSQKGGFLNRSEFAYAGSDTFNEIRKIAPGLIKNASAEINSIAQQRVNQIIRQGINRVLKKQKGYFQKFLKGPLKMCIKHPSDC